MLMIPETIPPNTVLGRSGIDAGPAEALPFTLLQSSITYNNQVDIGLVSGSATITISASPQQKVTVGSAVTLAFAGWPTAPAYAEIEIELINGGLGVTWPGNVHWLVGDGTNSTTFSAMGVTLSSSGTNWVVLWSRDAGTTIWGKAA